jgi:hypothetical protein
VFVQSVIYTLIVYSMMSFQWTPAKFFWFFYTSFLSFLYFTYYGMMGVAITPNPQVASIFAAAFYSLFNLFSGFIVPRSVSQLSCFSKVTSATSKHCALQSLWINSNHVLFRESRCGGFGTIGFVQWHGQSMD